MENFKRTEILVLGSTHLQSLGDKFSPKLLDNLIRTLKRFKPDLICVENLSGEVIERMQHGGDEETAKQLASIHIRFAKKAQKLVGLSRVEAEQRSRKLLSQKLTIPKRLELILLFLAAYDSNSAALQWSYLPQEVRKITKKLPKNICTFLDKDLTESNEVISIGVRLAHEFGLQMLVAIDDHPYSIVYADNPKAYHKVLKKGFDQFSNNNKAFLKDSEQGLKKGLEQGDLLPYYRYLNSLKVCRMLEAANTLPFLHMNHPSGLDRAWLSVWEMRNLVMTAYIRRASAMYAGKRVLIIVGASHKPLFDRYLKQLSDVKVVQFKDI